MTTVLQTPEGTIRRAFGWSLLGNAAVRLTNVVLSVVLARLLVPEEFGVFAVAMVGLSALLSINELGVSVAVVRWPGHVQDVARTVGTLALVGSIVLYAICFAVAPAYATLAGSPESADVLRLLALCVVIDGAMAVPSGLLTRAFRQKARTLIDLSTQVLAATLTVVLAVSGWGAWSLAVGQLVGNTAAAVLVFLVARPWPGLGWDAVDARALFRFGLPLALGSLFVFFVLNLDYVVVGSQLGPKELGIYFMAFTLSSWPVNLLSLAVRRVALPMFGSLQADGQANAKAFEQALAFLLAIAVPGCVALAVFADPIVQIVLGDKFSAAGSVLSVLATFAVVRIVSELAYDFLTAVGATTRVLLVQMLWAAMLFPALLVGVSAFGVAGAAWAHVAVGLAVVVPGYVVAMRDRVPPSAWLRSLPRIVLASAVVLSAGIAVDWLELPAALSIVVVLPMSLCAAMAITWPLIPVGFPRRQSA